MLARKIAASFSSLLEVEGIGLGGSQTAGEVDVYSDIDVYVYTRKPIPLGRRQAIVSSLGAKHADLDLHFWDPGDEWIDLETGVEVDVIYWEPAWIEAQLVRNLVEHQASTGYSTCFWHTVRNSAILFDRHGWLQRLKETAAVPYPEPLRHAVIAKNHPILRSVIPSYLNQIKKALERGDLVSVNHRLASLLASYFDIVFAVNRVPNPGEKRTVAAASALCDTIPEGMAWSVSAVLTAPADQRLVRELGRLIDGLDRMLAREGFDLKTLRG